MTSRRPVSFVMGGLVAMFAIGIFGIVSGGLLSHPRTGPIWPGAWVLTRYTLSNILRADSSISKSMFDHSYVYITGGPGPRDPVPPGWHSVPTVNFKSYADFSAAVSDGTMPRWTKAVLYDPEVWPQTPHNEQTNVKYYMRRFCQLAHREGWQAIMAPGTDLMKVYQRLPGETIMQAYVRYDIAGAAARYADVSATQSQGTERDTNTYKWFLMQTRAQALTANRHDVFLGGLTASLLGITVPAHAMYDAVISVATVVAGFFLNASMNAPDPTNAAQFLQKLAVYQQSPSRASQQAEAAGPSVSRKA